MSVQLLPEGSLNHAVEQGGQSSTQAGVEEIDWPAVKSETQTLFPFLELPQRAAVSHGLITQHQWQSWNNPV